MVKPKALVIGLGGLGTVAALTLEKNKKMEVSAIVRTQSPEFIDHGFEVESVSFGNINYKPGTVYKSVDECSEVEFDYVIVCTKNLPDSSLPCEQLIAPVIKPNTTIVLIQNGLDIDLPIVAKFPGNLVVSGISLTGSFKRGNKVHHIATDDMQFGIFKSNKLERAVAVQRLQTFVDAYVRDDNKIGIDNDVELTRWYKLCYNSVYNTVCALVSADVTRCHINNGNQSIFNLLISEIMAIAKSEGYELNPEVVNSIKHKSDGLFYTPSMQIDREKSQLLELEVILGNPLRIAQANNVPVPNLQMIYNLLKIVQFTIKENNGHFKLNQQDFRHVNSDDCPEVYNKLYK